MERETLRIAKAVSPSAVEKVLCHQNPQRGYLRRGSEGRGSRRDMAGVGRGEGWGERKEEE